MYIDFVLKQSTNGIHRLISKGESPDQTSECIGSRELLSSGN